MNFFIKTQPSLSHNPIVTLESSKRLMNSPVLRERSVRRGEAAAFVASVRVWMYSHLKKNKVRQGKKWWKRGKKYFWVQLWEASALAFLICMCERVRLAGTEQTDRRVHVAPLFHPNNPIQTHSHKLTCSSSSPTWTLTNLIAKDRAGVLCSGRFKKKSTRQQGLWTDHRSVECNSYPVASR